MGLNHIALAYRNGVPCCWLWIMAYFMGHLYGAMATDDYTGEGRTYRVVPKSKTDYYCNIFVCASTGSMPTNFLIFLVN